MASENFKKINACVEAKKNQNSHEHTREKSESIRIRVTPKEYKQIQTHAKELNTNVSAYVRLLTTLPLVIIDNTINNLGENATLLFSHNEIKKLKSNIRTVSDNYNQIARAYNTIAQWEWANEAEIEKQFEQINSKLKKIDKALPEIYQQLGEINAQRKVIL